MVIDDFSAKTLCVRQKSHHQLGALNAFIVGGPVVDIGGRHQLTALFNAGH